MPDFGAWRGSSKTARDVDAQRAVAAWMRIQAKPTVITILRGASDLPAQTVRIDAMLRPDEPRGGANTIGVQQWVSVLGVMNHPTVADTDIRKGDRFVINGTDEYRVLDTLTFPGEIQATAERTR